MIESHPSMALPQLLKYVSCLLILALFCVALHAQAPGAIQTPTIQNPNPSAGPVPITQEPHHRLVLQNDFIHVYNVMIPPLDATLPHQHDLPYLYVTLGPADLVNAVAGKPEVHLSLQDGETHYSPGHFAHLVRTDSGIAFHNITIELVRPQGTPRNICKDVGPDMPLDCPQLPAKTEQSAKPIRSATAAAQTPAKNNKGNKNEQRDENDRNVIPYFETDEIRLQLVEVTAGHDYVEKDPKVHALMIALTGANLDANLGNEHVLFLHAGDVLWMPAGLHRRVIDFLGTHSQFLLISFKDGEARPVSQ